MDDKSMYAMFADIWRYLSTYRNATKDDLLDEMDAEQQRINKKYNAQSKFCMNLMLLCQDEINRRELGGAVEEWEDIWTKIK